MADTQCEQKGAPSGMRLLEHVRGEQGREPEAERERVKSERERFYLHNRRIAAAIILHRLESFVRSGGTGIWLHYSAMCELIRGATGEGPDDKYVDAEFIERSVLPLVQAEEPTANVVAGSYGFGIRVSKKDPTDA